MNEGKIQKILEDIDPEGNLSDEAVFQLTESMRDASMEENLHEGESYDSLREQLEEETNWRKKAKLAARIISLGLDD